MLSVVTFLWHDSQGRWNDFFQYGPEHVDRLARGVRRHLSLPHKFICVTDQEPTLFKEPDYVVPLWDDLRELGGCYVRLKAFASEMKGLLGERFAWMDLDSVVVDDLDPLFDRDDDFVILKDANPPTPYCGSMLLMNAGARSRVWETFDRGALSQIPYVGTDQAWIGHCLGPKENTWVARDGALNYRWQVCQYHHGQLPRGARVVFFTGPLDPSQEMVQELSPWIRDHWV